MTAFTVYTALTAERLNPNYFKRLGQSMPGTVHVAMGRAMPVLESDYSYIVVRRSHREQRQGYHLLSPTKRQWRGYYAVSRRDFVVITISWDSGAVHEISNHATRQQADKAMRAAHKGRQQAKSVNHSDTL